jgi:ribonuclease Z
MHPHLEGWVGRSRALRTNWLYLPRLDLMIDAGDGCSTELGPRLGSPATLALTHGHGDHILGLPALIAARQFPSLHSGGPLRIVYPAGCPSINALRRAIETMWPQSGWNRIAWHPVEVGDQVPLGPRRFLEALPAEHAAHLPCLGYAVVERRTRLRPEARALPQDELLARIRAEGKAALEEAYEHTLFADTGDTRVIDHPRFQSADVLVYDSTFLSGEDRDEPTHAALPEVLEVAAARSVGTLVLQHFSQRYDRADLLAHVQQQVREHPRPFRTLLWDEERMIEVAPAE